MTNLLSLRAYADSAYLVPKVKTCRQILQALFSISSVSFACLYAKYAQLRLCSASSRVVIMVLGSNEVFDSNIPSFVAI
jgi:hypothetical protein